MATTLTLTEIIYSLAEAAKTADYALSKNMAAVSIAAGGGSDDYHDVENRIIVLLSPRRLRAALAKASDFQLARQLSQSAVVAEIDMSMEDTWLWSVNTSSAVNKFGPLAYELALVELQRWSDGKAWLSSDDSLKAGSKNVWNQFYKRSQSPGSGIERRWLGEWGIGYHNTATEVSGHEFLENPSPPTEAGFLATLQAGDPEANVAEAIDPATVGWYWAYRLSPGAAVAGPAAELFNAGNAAMAAAVTEFDIPEADLRSALDRASGRHFSRRYNRS